MSVVTAVMLNASVSEPPSILTKIYEWLLHHEYSGLHHVEDMCCNDKHPQMYMLGGGYNYFEPEKFAEFVMELSWTCPEQVVLLLTKELEPTKVYRPTKKWYTLEAIEAARQALSCPYCATKLGEPHGEGCPRREST